MTVTVKTADDAKVSYGTAKVTLVSESDKSTKADVTLDITINHIPGVSLDESTIHPSFETGAKQIVYPIKVGNTGNDQDTFELSIINQNELLSNGWNVTVQQSGSSIDNVTVAAGGENYVDIVIEQVADRVVPIPIKVRAVSSISTELAIKDFEMLVPELELTDEGVEISGDDVHTEEMSDEYMIYMLSSLIIMVAMVSLMVLGSTAKPARGRKKRRLKK